MAQYFKAYSPARSAVADISFPPNFDLPHLRNVPDYSPEEISSFFDYVDQKMDAEFGEYVLVGDYGTCVYRSGDERNPSHTISDDSKLSTIVWGA